MRQIIAAVVLGLTITTCSIARAQDIDPSTVLSTLDKAHPRLMLKDADLQKLKVRCKSDPILQKCVADLIKAAESSMRRPPLVHKKIGPRLLHVSRDCLRRTYSLALAWRWTGEKKYANKAVENLLIVCAFKDWNPSHFLDTAEMSHAVGVGYDWLYSHLDEATRRRIREGLIKNGLAVGVAGYKKKHWWSRSSHNWNQVCNGGLVAGALAIADTDPKYARAIIPQAVKLLPLAIRTYGPDGGWSEGPGYWHYATRYTACGLAAMETALGTDFGLSKIPGLSEAGLFPVYTTGPTGMYVNFADSGTRARRGPMGCMFYLARKFKRPFIANAEHATIAKRSATAEHVMWYVPPSKKKTARDLDRLFRGPVPVALFRGGWDSDALFVGIKAGYNQVNHGHLDLGNFEMDALGVRWSRDLGSDYYNLPGYWDNRNGGRRWKYYRLNSLSHSVPLINGANQSAAGRSAILKFEASKTQPLVVIDFTSAYKKAVSKATRGLKLVCGRKAVLVQDEFELTGENGKPAEITWAMTTDAKIAIKSKTVAELTIDGKKLTARILPPSGAEFAVESAEQKPPEKPNKGVSRLLARVNGAKGSVRIAVLLAPEWKGFTPPSAMKLTPLDKW